jgi:hypothetical protein
MSFTPAQVASMAVAGLCIAAVSTLAFVSGPSSTLLNRPARRSHVPAPREPTEPTKRATEPALTTTPLDAKPGSAAEAVAKAVENVLAVPSDAPAAAARPANAAAQPPPPRPHPGEFQVDTCFARMCEAFRLWPDRDAAPNLTFAELEQCVSRIASGLKVYGAAPGGRVVVEWAGPKDALCAQALLAGVWAGCRASVSAAGQAQAANVIVVGRDKLTWEAIDCFAGFCAPLDLQPGGALALDARAGEGEEEAKALKVLREWVASAAV